MATRTARASNGCAWSWAGTTRVWTFWLAQAAVGTGRAPQQRCHGDELIYIEERRQGPLSVSSRYLQSSAADRARDAPRPALQTSDCSECKLCFVIYCRCAFLAFTGLPTPPRFILLAPPPFVLLTPPRSVLLRVRIAGPVYAVDCVVCFVGIVQLYAFSLGCAYSIEALGKGYT